MSMILALALSSSLALDMNDVSILMPLKEQPELLRTLPRLGETFVYDWTEEQRNTTLSQISPNIEPVTDKVEDFVLTSLRIDPCANRLLLKDEEWKAGCRAEFRLVWQKLDAKGEDLVDSNIHTLYRLSPDGLKDVLTTLRKLHAEASVDTSGLALAPHPVIEKEGPDSPYLHGVLELVKKYAVKENLDEVANMVANTKRNWTFAHIGIEGTEPKFMAIPSMGKDGLDVVNLASEITTPEGLTLNVHTYGKIGNLISSGLLPSQDYSPELKRELEYFPILKNLVEGFAVENPQHFSPKTINCSTCHTAEKQKAGYDFIQELVGDKIWTNKFARPIYAYPKNAKGISDRPEGMGSFLPCEDYAVYGYHNSRWNLETPYARTNARSLQMFSYGDLRTPHIATRVVNDTADTLDLIEALGL